MIKTIVLKSKRVALMKAVRHIEEQLDHIHDGPVELLINVEEFDNHIRTMEVLFDSISIERIKEARKDYKPYSLLD